MIEKDLPITEPEEDVLERAPFAKQLAHMIEGYIKTQEKTKDGIVIGLEGTWGSGKTSLFHLMEHYLSTEILDVQTFNSWFATDRESLLRLFFESLGQVAGENNKSSQSCIVQMGRTLTAHLTPWMPILQGVLTLLDSSGSASAVIEKLMPLIQQAGGQASVMELKEQVRQDFLENQGKWILFFIDDIDRLTDAEIALLFQLVKNIADFPKVIYVLAYDKNIVVRALDKMQQERGLDYLHKVVQVSIPVPEVGQQQIGRILWDSLQNAMQQRSKDNVDLTHLHRIWKCILTEYVKTIRDCHRIVNAFSFRYNACGNDCDVGDLLAVTVLDLYEPDLISFLYRHRNTLLVQTTGVPEWERESDALKNVAGEMDARFVLDKKPGLGQMIVEMFPAFANQVGWGRKEVGTGDSMISQRICQVGYFERYFQLLLPTDAVPVDQVVRLLEIESPEILAEELKILRKNGCLLSFLEKARSICEAKPESFAVNVQFLQRFIQALSPLRLGNDTAGGLDSLWSAERRFLRVLLQQTLKKKGSDLWDDTMPLSIMQTPGISLSMMWKLLLLCGIGQHWPYGANGLRISHPVLSAEAFEQLSAYFVQKAEEASASPVAFLREEEIYRILTVWQWYSERQKDKKFERFWQEQGNGLPLVLKMIAYIQTGDASSGGASHRIWLWYPNAEAVIDTALQNTLSRFCHSPEKEKLTQAEAEKAAAYFVLVKHMEEEGRTVRDLHLEATEQEVKNVLQTFYTSNAEGKNV